ncbi:RNA polymerase sigma factor, sigma-70 family [Rhodobacter sp. 24-YEA-8]|nr:RNA polymerase sigma factor, sigma-70 family [Rhodobacter sp. 24-YEA-8]
MTMALSFTARTGPRGTPPAPGCVWPKNSAVLAMYTVAKRRMMRHGERSLPQSEAASDRAVQVQAGETGVGESRAGTHAAGLAVQVPGPAPISDTDPLVEKARAGDAGAFELLLSRHYTFIFRVACRWTGNRADAEDVTQTVCMRLGTTIRSFDGRASFQGWLYRVTLNAVRDQQRASARRGRLVAAASLLTDDFSKGDQEDALHVADIWRAVRALPEKQRDAILLVHGEGLAQAEAARIMGCKEVTVSWHIHQARKALRGVL